MMKVALVHHRMSKVGGLEQRMLNYTSYFANQGHSVHIYCTQLDKTLELPNNVSVTVLKPGWELKKYRRWHFNKRMQKVFKASDFDFSLTMERTAQQEAAISPGDHKGFLQANGKTKLSLSDRRQIEMDEQCFEHSRVLFPCSELIKNNMINYYGVPEEKMCVLPPPLNTQVFNTNLNCNKEELRKKFGMNPHKKSFVIVSTSHKRKGIPFLLELFKQLNPNKYELLIAGKPSIKTGLPHVKFLGYLTNPAELFAAADFTIHPSIFEPFGQVISESLACGTPVVLSKNTGWSPILPPAYGKVLNDFDITTWKKTLEEIEPKDFKIPSDFSSLWKLSTEEHIEKMLAFYGKG